MRNNLLFTIILFFLLIIPSLVCAQTVSQNIHVSDNYHRPQLTIFTIWFLNGTILGTHPKISNIPINSSTPWTFSYVVSNDINSAMNASAAITRTSFPVNIVSTFTNGSPIIVEAGNRATMQLSGTFRTNGSYIAGEVFSYYFDITVTCVNISSGQSYRSTFTIYGDTTYPQTITPTPTPTPTPSQTPTPTLSESPTPNPTYTTSPTNNPIATPSATPTPTPTLTPKPPTATPSEQPTISPSASAAAQPASTTDSMPSSSSPSATNTLSDSISNPTPSPTPSIPEFSVAILTLLLLAVLPAIVAVVKKSSKIKRAVTLLAAAILLLTCIIQISSAQTAAPMQAPSSVNFTLLYYNGTAFPTGDANAAGFTYGEMYLNVGGIMTSVSSYGSLFAPETNLVVLRNDGNTSINVNATLKNVNVPTNIEVSMQFRVISAGSYSSVSHHWIGYENATATNPVAPGQYMYLGVTVVLSQTNNEPSGTPTFSFNYSYDIEVFAVPAV